MRILKLTSPAKLNLYLEIINKRSDGFHNIKTLFQRISLCDELSFVAKKTKKVEISCSHPHVPLGSKNLVYKVAKIFQERFDVSEGVMIKIKKNIPVAAGLAGGSSNAATTLVGLNQLWNLKLSQNELLKIAEELGSDISFFLHDCSWALGTEKGHKIKKINISNILWSIIVIPRIKLYSSRVYGAFKMELTKRTDNVTILIHNLKKNNILGLSQYMKNDLEHVVLRQEPRLIPLKKKLKTLGAKGVMVSGSGPSVFGLTESQEQAKDIQKVLKRVYSQVYVVRTL